MFKLYSDTLIPTLLDSEGAINVLIFNDVYIFSPILVHEKQEKHV